MAPGEGRAEQKPRSLFDLRPDFFDSCRLLSDPSEILSIIPPSSSSAPPSSEPCIVPGDPKGIEERGNEVSSRWTCNTCKVEFDSLEDQRSHFKSDVHRLNVKLTVAGKSIIKEEDCDELGDESVFKDYDVSSISGSEDEFEKGSIPNSGISGKAREGVKQKLYIRLESGDTVSVWRCLILNESEDLTLEKNTLFRKEIAGSCVDEGELINRLKYLVHEPRDKTRLRTVLLASGGHFAGCVFDGNSVVAHKTFHRYVVRAKAGKQQSSKDASGKAANSAGSSLRRYNESALKKEIQELLVTWKPYFDSSSCIFIYAPSKNRQLLFGGEKPELSFQNSVVRHVPLTVRRPTLKEAKRLYNHLTHIAYEVNDIRYPPSLEDSPLYNVDEGKSSKQSNKEQLGKHIDAKEISPGACSGQETISSSTASEDENISLSHNGSKETPLHEASKCGNAQQVLELLEQGLDPCVKDARGRTPYTLAIEKEVRNTFRRFMALNLDKWDWQAASVPSPLTKEMEDSQAAKQAEKDAKRKAKAKELKKLRKAKEKAQAQAALSQSAATVVSQGQGVVPVSKGQPQSNSGILISKEEEQKRALAAEREKRAAAAERRIAELNARASSSEPKSGSDVICSCCNASLAGKIPFHRYNYKYCSTSCMHVHREMLEDG